MYNKYIKGKTYMKKRQFIFTLLPFLLLTSCGGKGNLPDLTSLKIQEGDQTIYVGETTQLTFLENPTSHKDVSFTWSSSNPEVASINKDGLLTAISKGSSTISITASNGVKDTINANILFNYKTHRDTSFLADSSYKNGFTLISPESTNQYVERDLDYEGAADKDFYKESDHPHYWSMCQWWTPYNFVNASYRKENDTHIYENESRYFGINTKTSELTMKLDADMEYKKRFPETGVLGDNASWSHFLIQQSFPEDLWLYPSVVTGDLGLHVTFDITINEATYKKQGSPIRNNDCASLIFYLLIRNNVPADADYEKVGKRNAKMWFGVPIYDTRYDAVPEYRGGDVGFEGATGHYIYSISSGSYMGYTKPALGITYHVDIDVIDYLKNGFIFAATNGYLTNCQWQNMVLDYMNFGWEIPGNYAISSTVKNMDIYVA